jgi:peptide/nickel transport system permease protein
MDHIQKVVGGVVRWLGRFAAAQPLGAASAAVILLLVLVAVFAGLFAPYDPYEPIPLKSLHGPSWAHPLGNDELGRDVLSRIIHGSRVSLWVGLVTVSIATGVGAMVGLVTGYLEGWVDLVVQRVIDAMLALPGLVLALALVSILPGIIPDSLRPGTTGAVLAVAIIMIPSNARVVRGAVLTVKQNQYFEAARAIGCSGWRIAFRHTLPNVAAPIIVLASIWVGSAIIIEASLSFLGVGTQPPDPSWGLMLGREGRRHLESAPWLSIFPGLAISVVVLAFNMLGDSLRDILDPRQRGAQAVRG